jgi:hypothetical protein
MRFDPQKVLDKARRADTEDLLDRVTLFREDLEPEAVEILEAELAGRGVTPEDIHQHLRTWKHRVLRRPDGSIPLCSFCSRAAVETELDWHRIFGLVPVFKRTFHYCQRHWAEKHPERTENGAGPG